MKKAVVTLVIIGLVSVLGFGSVLERVAQIGSLAEQYSGIVQWAAQSPYERHLTAAKRMKHVVDQAEA